jgi:putative membrane protein
MAFRETIHRMIEVAAIPAMALTAAVALVPVTLIAQGQQVTWQTAGAPMPAAPGPATVVPGALDSGSMGAEGQVMKDKIFVRKAAAGGLAEVQFGQLALQKTTNDGVKQFAQKMVDDHTTMNNDMKPIADNLGVPIPKKMSKPDQAEYAKLSGLSGSDFDREYITVMVKDHRKDIRAFHEEASVANDPQLKDAVTGDTKLIWEHLVLAHKLANSNGIDIPRPAPPPAAPQAF